MLLIVVGVILFVCVWKWVLFLLLEPIVYAYKKHKLRKWSSERNNQTAGDGVEGGAQNKGLKYHIRVFITSFIRYIDIQIGLIPSMCLRYFIYKYMLLVDLKKNVVLHYGTEIRDHEKLSIGEGSIVGDKAILDARNGIVIGKHVNISSNASIWTEQHDHRDPWFLCDSNRNKLVKIGDRAWIGPNTLILPGVQIGVGAVVAGGSVVTKDVPPFSIVAGIPAKTIGERNRNLLYEFQGEYGWFY